MEVCPAPDNAGDIGETKGFPEVRTRGSLLKIVETAHGSGGFDLLGGMMVSETAGITGGSAGTSGDERLLIEFELAGESYGVEISTVREIIRMQQVTQVPGVPDVVEGIINLRGVVVPIVDLRKRLGVTVTEQSDDSRVIVTEIDEALVGVLVDAVTGVIRLTADNLQALSKHARTSDSDYLEGVAQFDERLVVLVNIVRALERESLQEVKWDGEVISRSLAEASSEEPTADEAPEGGLPLRIELLETSFEALKPHGEELVAYFYDRLFEQYPGVQPLFAGADMQEQQGKLLSALATVVASLRTPEALVPHLQELGRRHVAYGAEPAHYEAVGQVLLESMEAIAGDLWNDELLAAWTEAYGIVSSVMIEAASEVEAPVQLHVVEDEPVAEPAEGLPLQIELLETSFEAVKPHGEELVAYFYDRLFEEYPGVQPLFANADMQKQQGMLLSALATVVASLRTPEALVPHLQELGRRHVEYGAEPEHYGAVGAVLLESLKAIAGDLWNDELHAAWAEAYGLVSSVMIEAAAETVVEPIEFAEAKKVVEQKKPAAKKPAARKPAAKSTAAAKKPAAKATSRAKKQAAS